MADQQSNLYSKVYIQHPVLLSILGWNFLKGLHQTTSIISEKVNHTVSFIYLLTVPIKRLIPTSWSGFFEIVSIKQPHSPILEYISEYLNMYEHWTLLKFEGQIKNLPNLNATLFQTFNVTSLKTATVMESVMVQENANAMTIGNQKQTALVTILNWIWLDYSSTELFFIPCQMKQNSFRVCLQR